MKRNAGFTLIELLITITIMVILLTLTVVALRGNQANARDEKRKTDVAVIAQQLEDYYRTGNEPVSTLTPAATVASAHFVKGSPQNPRALLAVAAPTLEYTAGQYPPTYFLGDETSVKATLRNIDPSVLRAPDVPTSDPISLKMATTTGAQTPDVNSYVYQPLDRDGQLCADYYDACTKFTLYYKLETNSAVQTIQSKHQ